MQFRRFVLRSFLAAALVAPAVVVPATAGQAADDAAAVTVRISLATFTGRAWIERGRPGRPASMRGYAGPGECTVAGVRTGVSSPFLTTCEFEFETGLAPVSSNCTGGWIHNSTLTFNEPVTGEHVTILYTPTVTKIVEGDGNGDGVSPLHLGSVHFAIASLCAVSEQEGEANLVGYASAL